MAARSPGLRVAQDGEKAPAPKTVSEAAARGTQRELLVAMRDRIAKTVEDSKCPPRDLASLSRRLMEIAKEIEAIDAEAEDGDTAGVPDEAFNAEAL